MAYLDVTPDFNLDMEPFDIQTNDFYENWNERHRQFLGNDAALKKMHDDLGLSVVDGALCVTYEEE